MAAVSGEIWLAGDLSGLEELKRSGLHFTETVCGQPYGVNVARLGLEKIKAGQIDDPLKLVPSYSHQPHFREFKTNP